MKFVKRLTILCLISLFLNIFYSLTYEDKKENNTINPIEIVLVSPEFSEYEKGLIESALNEWSYSTKNLIHFIVLYNKDIFDIDMTENNIILPIMMRPVDEDNIFVQFVDIIIDGEILGFYDKTAAPVPNILIVRNRIYDDAEYKTVVMHEIGHSLGLAHLEDKYNLMYPSSKFGSDCITDLDLKSFCQVYKCDYLKMNWCKSKTNFCD